jgi:hypothetical protein
VVLPDAAFVKPVLLTLLPVVLLLLLVPVGVVLVGTLPLQAVVLLAPTNLEGG